VRADNPSYFSVEAVGSEVEVRVTASSASSARATIDDLLACLRAAERTARDPARPSKDP
jgi:hypothetical protein